MAEIGAVHIPQPIPDVNQLRPGQRPSTPLYGLRATPPVFRALVVGGNNSNVDLGTTRAAMIPALPLPSRLLASRSIWPPFSPTGQSPPTVTINLLATITTNSKAKIYGQVSLPLALSVISRSTATAPQAAGLYESLIRADRPLAWWGFDDDPTLDETGRGYDLTPVGVPYVEATLLARANEVNGASRGFNGSSDAYTTAGTLYDPPDVPPSYHSATAAAGSTTTTAIVSPAGIEAGDLMLACIVNSTQTATISAAPSGWTQVGTTLNAGTCAVAVYKRLPVADEPPAEYAWTWSTAGTTLGTILVYRNCDQDVSGLIFDSGQQATSSSSFHSTTTESSPVQAHALALWCGEFSGTITPDPTGVNRRVDISTGNVKIIAAEYDLTAAGSVAKTATTSTNTTLGTFLLTFGAPNEVREDALDALAENISLHALIYPDTVAAGTRTIIRKQDSWGLQLNGATVEFVYKDGGGTNRTVTGPSVSASTATHLVVTDDGTDIHFFKNGVETTSTRLGAAGYTTNANQVTIGAYHSGSYSNYWDGRLDEVAVFGAAISASMVATYWQALTDGTFGDYFQPLIGTPRYPRAKLEVAWASAPTDQTLVWEDVSGDLRATEAISTRRGRNFELDRVEGGTLNFTLSNRERTYDPDYTGSPLYPNVKPTRAVRLRAQSAPEALVHSIFFGYTEGHPLLYPSYGADATAHFSAVDPFKALAIDQVLGTFVRGQELTGERVAALLDGYPGIPFSGESGQSEVTGDNLDGVNSLDHVLQVAETEGGVFYAAGDGSVVFEDRHHRTKYERDIRATYGDGASMYPVKAMAPLIDEARLFTAASVTPASGRVQATYDVVQAAQHFLRTKILTTLHASDNDAQAMAEAFAHRYATPRTRIPSIDLQPAGYDTAPLEMWEVVLGHELSHRIRSSVRPIGDTTVIEREHFIEGISHTISRSDWVVSLSVSPAELEGDYWLLGTGELGDTSGLTATTLGW